jgi:hypothetical protein
VFVLSWVVAIVAVLGLLPWRLAAQTEPDDHDADKPAKPAAEQVMKVEATSGRFKITVDRVRRDKDHMVSIVPSGFPLSGGKGSQNSETHSVPGGQTGGSTASMTGGDAGAFAIPNLILDVGVKGPYTNKNQQLICTVNGKVRAVDDLGHAADSAGLPSWLRLQLSGVEYRQGSGRTAIHLALPESDPPARYLKSVDGDLLIAEATINQMTFQKRDLSRQTSKRAGEVSARLEHVSESSDGVDVTLAVSSSPSSHGNVNPMSNPMEDLQQMMRANAPGRVNVVLVDSEGKTHQAGGDPKKSVAPNGMTFYGGGGGGGGGGGSSGGSWGSSDSSGRHTKRSFSSTNSNPAKDYHFDALPSGVTIKAITCTVTDITGEPQTVPFHFENIRLPESRK